MADGIQRLPLNRAAQPCNQYAGAVCSTTTDVRPAVILSPVKRRRTICEPGPACRCVRIQDYGGAFFGRKPGQCGSIENGFLASLMRLPPQPVKQRGIWRNPQRACSSKPCRRAVIVKCRARGHDPQPGVLWVFDMFLDSFESVRGWAGVSTILWPDIP